MFGLFNDKYILPNYSHRSNNIANTLHIHGSHIYYVNSATCFDLLGHFYEIKINEILYNVCVCVCMCVCVCACVRAFVCVCVCVCVSFLFVRFHYFFIFILAFAIPKFLTYIEYTNVSVYNTTIYFIYIK